VQPHSAYAPVTCARLVAGRRVGALAGMVTSAILSARSAAEQRWLAVTLA
jgi:hypothetical protein